MTKIIGLTGGIGSGKTTIARLFMEKGIPAYIADDEARKLMKSTDIIQKIKAVFGSAIFENEILIREKLAKIVFTVPEKLKELNAIIHPAVKIDFENWLQKHENYPFVIYETAILFESGSYTKCDLILSVTAPLEMRIQRVMQRDKTSREEVLKRIHSQWTDVQRNSKSDYIIENDSLEMATLKVGKILKILNI